MGLILDLAVVALAAVVIGSLALLAWTLAVSAVRSARRERERIVDMRLRVADAERGFTAAAARASGALHDLAERSAAARERRYEAPGESPDA